MSVRTKEETRQRLHDRIRKKLRGTAQRPRLAVFRSQGHIYAQVVDDDLATTLCAASSLDKSLRKDGKSKSKTGGNVASAKAVGALIASRAKDKGIEAVVFDRGGYKYHGRVRAFAEGAREGGLKF